MSAAAGPYTAVKFVIDAAKCRHCGKAGDGLRCEQPLTRGYESELVRARTAQQWEPRSHPTEAPCTAACPLSLCIQGYAKHIAAGEYKEALGHIMERTALPESVCRVCDRPCEDVCVRAAAEDAVAINDLKRFVVEWANEQDTFPWSPTRNEPHGSRVAVVGAGPSGLSAARELCLRGYEVTLFDAADRPGGVLAQHIPRYRLPTEAIERDVARILELGVRFVGGTTIGADRTLTELLDEGYAAVYLAVGAHRSKQLEVEGAETAGAPPMTYALAHLARARDSDSTTSHGFKLEGDLVVIGGGDAAVDTARTALRLGAATVTIACIEDRESMPALVDQIAAAEAEGIEVRTSVRPLRFEAGAVVFTPTAGQATDDRGTETRVAADHVVAAIGQEIDGRVFAGAPDLALTQDGMLSVDAETGQTTSPRIYAGGDVVPGRRTVTGAMAWGLRVAWAIDREVRGRELADSRMPPPPLGGVTDPPRLEARSAHRRQPEELDPAARLLGFAEVRGSLSEVDARAEAARCLVCSSCGNCRACIDLFGCPAIVPKEGRITIDTTLCTGCAVCADFCPNHAIVPVEEP